MHAKARSCIFFMTVAAILGSAPADAGSMSRFDITKVQSWEESLAICDITRFLVTEPTLNTEYIISAAPEVSSETLRGPYFIPSGGFYSKVMRQTFDVLEGAGRANMARYGEARLRYAKAMLGSYPNASTADKSFLADQMKLCYALAVNTRQQAQQAAARKIR
jgi:hypothetical protein